MKKICLYARADRLYFYVPLAKVIEKDAEYDYFFITESAEETDYVFKNFKNPKIYSLYQWLDCHNCKNKKNL